jgi:hypothetical protein
MAEGFLGGFGDFLTGGGIYSDPKAINPTYGVPEGDVRQAAINQLSQLSALALAAGQPMEGAQRAQLLAQMGQTGGQFNTNLYNAAQRRLMTSQMQQQQRDIEELGAIRDLQQKDPEGLAKRMGGNITAEMVRTFSPTDLREVLKQITIKRATIEPTQAYLTASGGGAPAPMGGAAAAPVASAPTFAAPDPFLQSLEPNARALVQQYSNAINAANQQGNAKAATDLAEALYKQVPGLKEAQTETAKTKAAEIAGAPSVYGTAIQTIKNIDAAIAHPGRETGTGASAVLGYVPATSARDFAARVEQLSGSAFLEAYQSLRGGGAISQAEGDKAQQAVARLKDRFISEEDYLTALKEYRDIVETGAKRALQKMGGRVPEGYDAIPQMPSLGRPQTAPTQRQGAPQRSLTGGTTRIISVEPM